MTVQPTTRRVAHPRELHTHLASAAARGVRATLEPGGGAVRLRGVVGDELLAEADGPVPPEGTAVTVGYGWDSLHGRFDAVVLESGARVRLSLPTCLELTDRRVYTRYPVPPALGLAFHGQAPMRAEMGVQDLSDGGLALTLPAGTRLTGPQHLLMGMLQTPGGRPIPVDLEIRNARPSVDGTRIVLGTRLAVIAPGHRPWYQQLVARCAAVAG